MGRAIIGGVITSTILTLVVVPVLYSYLVRLRKPAAKAAAAGKSAHGISMPHGMPGAMPADKD
jgi:putative effector of murein hydrolase